MALADAKRSVIAVIDVQEGLFHAIKEDTRSTAEGKGGMLVRIQALLQAAGWLGIPVLVSEQYPQGLGSTLSSLSAALPAQTSVFEKRCFAASADIAWYKQLENYGRSQVFLTGLEAHVCVLQTAWDLKSKGWECAVVVDTVASCHPSQARTAIDRMREFGITITNSEMLLFEWIRGSEHECFKQVSQLVKSLRC